MATIKRGIRTNSSRAAALCDRRQDRNQSHEKRSSRRAFDRYISDYKLHAPKSWRNLARRAILSELSNPLNFADFDVGTYWIESLYLGNRVMHPHRAIDNLARGA